jgi:hypothetical protein
VTEDTLAEGTLVFSESVPTPLLDRLCGTVNEAEFAGHPPGTLLFGGQVAYRDAMGWNSGDSVGPGLPFPCGDFSELSAFMGPPPA